VLSPSGSKKRNGPDSEDGHVQEALKYVKCLSNSVSEHDCSACREHIGNKLQRCRRSSIEISVVQYHTGELLSKLTVGAYG
jgi:hypothetical protein